MRLILALIALQLGACVTLTPEQREDRAFRERDYAERYLDFRRDCDARGGTVVVDSLTDASGDGVPRRGSYYYCR